MVDLADNDWHACIFNRHSLGVEMSGFATRGFDDPLLATTARMSKGLRRDRGLRLPAHSRKGPVKRARRGGHVSYGGCPDR